MSAPNAPTLSVANGGNGTSAVATVSGDAGIVHQLFYRALNGSAWIAGEARVGDGPMTQTGLSANMTYLFQVVSANTDSEYSLPSNLVSLLVIPATEPIRTAIGAAVERCLLTLVSAHLSEVQRPVSAGMPQSPKHRSCYVLQGDPEPPSDEDAEVEATSDLVIVHQPFEIYLFAWNSDSDTTPVDTAINAMESAVVSALIGPPFADYLDDASLAGVVDRVWFDGNPTYFRTPHAQSISGMIKRLMVQFSHAQESLYLPS